MGRIRIRNKSFPIQNIASMATQHFCYGFPCGQVGSKEIFFLSGVDDDS